MMRENRLDALPAIIRDAGEALQRQFGREAAEILMEALDDAEREIEQTFGEETESA